VQDRVVLAMGAVALVLGGCSSSTAPGPGTVALWVANVERGGILGYTAAQLASSASAAPAVVLTTPSGVADGVAFDNSGNLWVAEPIVSTVVEYSAFQLATSGSPTPRVTLTANAASSLSLPGALAFDARGNLWIANGGSMFNGPGANTLVEFTASQLATSGSPTPAVTLNADAGSINGPAGLAFDHSGNLWLTNFSSGTVVVFAAGQLASSGSPLPAVTLSDNGANSLNEPESLAFDRGGNLWVANANTNTVVEFARSQLGTTGSPTPAVTLTNSGPHLALAFDGHANLWVSNGDTVLEFAPSQLMASGAPTPTVTLSGPALVAAVALAFAP
jgi:sugar lactone lactonase YvrE